jgi:hypothetical protein
MGIGTKISEIFGNPQQPGVVIRPGTGTIHISSNGTSTVSSEALEKIVFARFREMTGPDHATAADSVSVTTEPE